MKKLAVLALVAVSSFSFAQSAVWDGALTSADPVYNRTVEDGSGLSGVGTAVFYDVQPFFVLATGEYTMEVRARNAGEDTFAFIYRDLFNPGAPTVNFVGGNDDWLDFTTSKIGGGNGSPTTLILTSGVQYFAITTSFSNGDQFAYDNNVTPLFQGGEARLGIVPEPATMLALGAGLAAIAARRRRK